MKPKPWACLQAVLGGVFIIVAVVLSLSRDTHFDFQNKSYSPSHCFIALTDKIAQLFIYGTPLGQKYTSICVLKFAN